MLLLNIGYGNMVSTDRIIAIEDGRIVRDERIRRVK